mgnify:CR=1 FL=1
MNANDLKVEFFTDPKPEDAITEEQHKQEALEYATLGMTTLAARATQRIAAPPEMGRRLSQDELALWRWRYPQIYMSSPIGTDSWETLSKWGQRRDWWSQLTWPLPADIRSLALSARTAYDALEIWTPELKPVPRIGPSPILIGVRGSSRYLLARWAEALEPLEEIRAKMLSRRGRRAFKSRRLYRVDDYRALHIWLPATLAGCGLIMAGTALAPDAPRNLAQIFGLLSLMPAAWAAHSIWLRFSIRRACEYAGWIMAEE